MNSSLRCVLVAVFLGSLSTIAAAAGAGDDVPKRTVRFADLNLSNTTGVAVLYRRIRSAARAVCEPAVMRDLQLTLLQQRCTEEAIERAVSDVNSPLLTSYYRAKARPAITVARR